MTEKEFLEKMVDEAGGFRTGTYLGINTTLLDINVVKVNYKGDDMFLPLLQHDSLEKPEKVGDSVLILGEKVIGKAPVVVPKRILPQVSWSDVIGLDSQVSEIIDALNNMDEDVRGILLYGPTGTGKTLIAKAIAYQILGDSDERHFFYLKGGATLSRYVGEAERKITEVFQSAREVYKDTNKRPIIFIDEADAILKHRGEVHYIDTIVDTFLSEMDGFDTIHPLVVLATNHRDKLDKAVIRPGRMDLHLHITHPSKADFKKQLQHYGVPETFCDDCVEIIETRTREFNGALAQAIGKFARQKAKGGDIQLEHVLKAIEISC